MFKKLLNVLLVVTFMAGFIFTSPALAVNEVDSGGTDVSEDTFVAAGGPPHNAVKAIDYPSLKDYQRNQARIDAARSGDAAEASALALTGKDRVLVLLVEFAGEDTFTYTPGTSDWDPLGVADMAEDTGTPGDCSLIDAKLTDMGYDITQPIDFTYGPTLHNEIPRPLSAEDRSGDTIWTEDFSPDWFSAFMFGNGVDIEYTRVDGSEVSESFIGQSVNNYYKDLSDGTYEIEGDVIGWLPIDHSTWYYDADECPGARSTSTSGVGRGWIPEGGNTRDLVKDALDKVNELYPDFDWTVYDQNEDGIIDRLWIVHSGYGEEDSTALLNRTDYGEAAVWSHSSAVTPAYVVDEENDISASAYIVMPENGGIGVFAHEYSHNLGSMDLYAYQNGETSTGFWSLMADDWTGYPIGFEPPAMDPMHLDWWGWLNPVVVSDPSQVYEVTLQQPTMYEGDVVAEKGARIDLPPVNLPLAVPPWSGDYYYWGGKGDLMNSMMTATAPVSIPVSGTTKLSFELVYDIEEEWDFMWVQVSADGGTTWDTLANANTNCSHVNEWIGGLYGFTDECGFSGYNLNWPAPELEEFDLSAYAGQDILYRLWYMTDWGTTYSGPFVDNVLISNSVSGTLLSDNAETVNPNVTFEPNFVRSDGTMTVDHSFYVQWRNTNENGGYDSALGDSRWRYGPANTGLLVWYNNTMYTDNEVFNYLTDYPSFGPKGAMLVVDSHPDPYRYESIVEDYPNEGANVPHRSLMRDATFTLADTVDFTMPDPWIAATVEFPGREAVKTFHDALGYYPGASFVPRAPLRPDPVWITNQWDASVVMPAKDYYTINAPGLTGEDPFRFDCAINAAGLLGCYWYPSGTGYDGGSGNPAESDSQYGWHVELVDEAADHTTATVRIWNSMYAVDSKLEAAKSKTKIGETVDYVATFTNTGSAQSYYACAEFDKTKVEYLADSASGSPMLFAECPYEYSGGMTPRSEINVANVGALVWVIDSALPGETETFNFKVKTIGSGLVNTDVQIANYDFGPIYTSLTEQNLSVDWMYFMPIIVR